MSAAEFSVSELVVLQDGHPVQIIGSKQNAQIELLLEEVIYAARVNSSCM